MLSPVLVSPLRHKRLCHRECHSHRAMSGNWPLLTATSATDQKAEKSLRRRAMRTIYDENCQSRGRGFSRVFSGGWRIPTFDARSAPRVTIRVTTPRDPKGSSGVIRHPLHSQVRHFSSAVTLLMAPNRLPKLDVAGSNPVGRSISRGYEETRNPFPVSSDHRVTTAVLGVPRLPGSSPH